MIIHSINSINSDKNINNKKTNNSHFTSCPYKNNLTSDVFQKSNVSFGASDGSDDLFSSVFSRTLDLFLGSSNIFLDSLGDILHYNKQEIILEGYFEILSNKKFRQGLSAARNEKIENFNNYIFADLTSDIDYFNKLFTDAGITKVFNLENFMRLYGSNPDIRKIFAGQNIEAVKIYGLLNSKNDFSRYPDLLLYLYNQEEDSENPDYSVLNKYPVFLRQIGINNSKEFDEKYSHLKPDFNNFDSISDKFDAIDYLYRTYDRKIELLSEILKANPKCSSCRAEKVYNDLNSIIDYLYKKNEGESLSGLERYIDVAVTSDKIKAQSLKSVADLFHNFETPEDKINFYQTLSESNIQINEFNAIAGKSFVSDNDVLTNLLNYESLSQYISDVQGVHISIARDIYKKFKDIINAVYTANNEDVDKLNELLNLIKRFDLKNSESFLNLYNRVKNSKNKEMSSLELANFVDLFRYSDSKDLFKDAKQKNISVFELLQEEKEKFETVKDAISAFIKSDTTGYFIGKTEFDIYTEFKDIIPEDGQNISEILEKIVSFNINNSEEYEQKTNEFDKFADFFQARERLLQFIADNKIKFDNSDEESNYRQNCLDIIQTVFDEKNPDKSYELISALTKSGFLHKSKPYLSQFISSSIFKENGREILTLIANRQIDSLKTLGSFFKIYQGEDGNVGNIITWLQSLPIEIDFTKIKHTLSFLQSKIDEVNIPICINNDNILNIDSSIFDNRLNINAGYINDLVKQLANVPQSANFIHSLPRTFKDRQFEYSRFRIAQEIVSRYGLTDESYKNLVEKLKIDKHSLMLNDDCSDYIYIKAVEKVLPQEFIDFVNSNDWINYSGDNSKIPNVTMHARLRTIDRFALANDLPIENLYSEEIKQMLKNLFATIYSSSPISIKGSDLTHRIIADFLFNNKRIETVFSNNGELITIVPKKNN